jgi:proteasome lid subunit RPN8/RPN11
VRIAQKALDDMLAHAREDAPHECCGLLIGDRHSIERSVRTRNLEASPTRYTIDPEDHFAAIHAARAENRRVVGAYHSHPAGPAFPSPSDVAEARWGADFLYVIVSLAGVSGEILAYRVKRGTPSPVNLVAAA